MRFQMCAPGSQKEPKQLHGRKEVLDPLLDTVIRSLLMHREWSTGPSPVSLPRHAVTREGGEAAGYVGIYKENETIKYRGKGEVGKVPC